MVYDPVRRRYIMPTSSVKIWDWDGAIYHVTISYLFHQPCDYGVSYYDSVARKTFIHSNRSHEAFFYFDDTPETCADLGVSLNLPTTMFSPGETFFMNAHICNTTGMILDGYPLFGILDVYGALFWGPGFTAEFDSYIDEQPLIPEGESVVALLPEFIWPAGAGSANGIKFIAALTDPDIQILYGDYSMIEFGWSE